MEGKIFSFSGCAIAIALAWGGGGGGFQSERDPPPPFPPPLYETLIIIEGVEVTITRGLAPSFYLFFYFY